MIGLRVWLQSLLEFMSDAIDEAAELLGGDDD